MSTQAALTEIAAGRPGVYDIPEDEYHADLAPEPSLSSTLARLMIERSPRHAWTASARLNPAYVRRESEAFDIGRSAHSLILGKGADIAVIHADNWTTKSARQERDDARAAGQVPMLIGQFEAVETMVDIANGRLAEFGICIDRTRTELAAFAQIDDVWCRALVDYAPSDPRQPLIDIKTCEDASPAACVRSVAGYGYDVQAAHYLDVWRAATGERRGFRFVFIEKSPPHEVSVVELHQGDDDADWMLTAHDKAREARLLWRDCLSTGQWPGYPAAVAVVGAPAWHAQKWADRPRAEKPSPETLAAAHRWQAPHGDAA